MSSTFPWGAIIKSESLDLLEESYEYFNNGYDKKGHAKLDQALKIDPNNVEAYTTRAYHTPDEDHTRLRIFEKAEKIGRQHLLRVVGPDVFDTNHNVYGEWWGILATRPYMRALYGLMTYKSLAGDYEGATENILEMMGLCNSDNLGNRSKVPILLIQVKRYLDAMNFCLNWMEVDGEGPPKGGLEWSRSRAQLERIANDPPPELRKMVQRQCDIEIVYSLALAAFYLCGNCTLANLALKAAAKGNKHILWHLAMGKRRPPNYTSGYYTMDGPVLARNYLVLAHPLWMEEKTRAWWSSQSDAVVTGLQKCEGPDCAKIDEKADKFKNCSACKLVSYCSRECQRNDWPNHKRHCRDDQENKPM